MFDLQAYVYEQIPIVNANRLRVEVASNGGVRVLGRLSDHVNHVGSAFGGSVATALTLAAWGLIRLTLEPTPYRHANILIATQYVVYRRPVLGDFCAVAKPMTADEHTTLITALATTGKARLTLNARLVPDGPGDDVQAKLSADFVVMLDANADDGQA